MAAVALQRELDAYSDAISKYNQQAQRYTSAASTHNANVDAYNAAMLKNTKFDKPVTFLKQGGRGSDGRYWASNYTIYDANNKAVKSIDYVYGPPAGYKFEQIPGTNEYVARKVDAADPGKFSMEQPTSPGAAPSVTAAQVKKLGQPSLTDVERTGSSGLISSAFNY